jgi:hypothetical protein
MTKDWYCFEVSSHYEWYSPASAKSYKPFIALSNHSCRAILGHAAAKRQPTPERVIHEQWPRAAPVTGIDCWRDLPKMPCYFRQMVPLQGRKALDRMYATVLKAVTAERTFEVGEIIDVERHTHTHVG